MKENEIIGKIKEIIKPFVKNEKAFNEISLITHFTQDLKINSARLVDIVISFEDEFHLSINDQEAVSIRTVGDAISIIQQKLKAPAI